MKVTLYGMSMIRYFAMLADQISFKFGLFTLCMGMTVNGYASERMSDTERIDALEARIEHLMQSQEEYHSVLEEALNRVAITGYVSLRGGQLDEKDFSYLGGLGDQWSFSNDTTYGIQIKAPLTEHASVLLQFSGDSIENQAAVDWAFLEYEVAPTLTLRGGRLRVPGFMISEYREVGYAYPWVDPPLEVYGLTPFLRYEGLDLRYFFSIGEFDLRLNPFIGSTRNQTLMVGRVKYAEQNSQFGGLDIRANYRELTARFSYSVYDFHIVDAVWDSAMEVLIEGQDIVPGNPPITQPGILDVVDSLIGISSGLEAVDAAYGLERASLIEQRKNYRNDSIMGGDQHAEYYSLGASYDSEHLFLMAEIVKGGIDGAFPDSESGYMMLGYRFGNWMPHLTYARIESTDDDERELLPDLQLSDALWNDATLPQDTLVDVQTAIGGVETLIELVNINRNLSNTSQRSWIAGLRWDPKPGVALKVEYQRVEPLEDSYGYILPQAVVDGDGSGLAGLQFQDKVDLINVYKFSLDLIF